MEVRLCVDIYLRMYTPFTKASPRKNKADNSIKKIKIMFVFVVFSSQDLFCSCFFGDVRCIPLLGYSVSAEILRKGKECGSPPPPPPLAHRLFRPGAASIMPCIHYYPPMKNPAYATGAKGRQSLSRVYNNLAKYQVIVTII